MRLTYQNRLTLSFVVIFVVFTACIVIFDRRQALYYRTEALEERLDAYADIIHTVASRDQAQAGVPATLAALLPPNLRLTFIDGDGQVVYDNLVGSVDTMENHAGRPEVQQAHKSGSAYDIRTSATTRQPYIYYAKYFDDGFVRVALPYDIQVRHFLKPDNISLYIILGLFLVGLLFIHYVGGLFGGAVKRLRDFAEAVASDGNLSGRWPTSFPNDELGDLEQRIIANYRHLQEKEQTLAYEREKLLLHVQSSAEGICFFRPDATVEFYNGLFLQYLGTIGGDIMPNDPHLLDLPAFAPVRTFRDGASEDTTPCYETRLQAQGREFLLKINLFEDGGFEIVLNDITQQEKTQRLKQEMTGNIAHELRTPVTSIRGYLETLLETPLPPEKERDFIGKAYRQTLSLSELIRDMSLLTKIENSAASFRFAPVRLDNIIDRVMTELEPALQEKRITLHNELPAGVTVLGNESLIYSVFRNLTDNVIHHAGSDVTITIALRDRRDGFLYLSFADNGRGIAEPEKLHRLFERFYRVDEGRTRDNGGSGLGLSIVRNIINLHKGTITVRSGRNGGLDFLFSLPTADRNDNGTITPSR